jgi:hypothetical protein
LPTKQHPEQGLSLAGSKHDFTIGPSQGLDPASREGSGNKESGDAEANRSELKNIFTPSLKKPIY